ASWLRPLSFNVSHRKNMVFHLLMLILLTIPDVGLAAEEIAPKPGTFCWPMHYAGVVAGTTQDKHVVRLLGHGAHRPKESEGVRYYVDSGAKMTMKISTFTDGVVGEIALEHGVSHHLTKGERVRAVTKSLESSEGFGNWHALRLGSTREEVQANLGLPAETTGPDVWVFNAECTCELPQYLTLHFEEGKVSRVVFSAPPG
ncbi:hypothetical protein LNV09_24610, partial [Paucibacter sp. B2R-40]|uniref:hypothetical protein n=1 Tax=Paucibacter sp. B2R-40 TaxID=2893554 RepID=UPI0021E38BDF